jgi:hypothetical protein
MSIVNGKQPSVRFNLAGPFAMAGVSYLPKVLTFSKTGIAGTENEDFITLPAGTFIAQAFLQVDTAVNNTGVVTLGTDGAADGLINATDFDASTDGNWATNIGSATATYANGLYLHAADTLRLATTGTADEGAVSGFIVYYETAAMNEDGIHFEL